MTDMPACVLTCFWVYGGLKDQDFKYLGSWTEQSRDVQTRKAQAWQVLNKLGKLWTSDLPGWWKIRFFKAAVETILLYGCATWSLTKSEEKSLDRSYTRMLRKVLNVNALDKMRNEDLYGDLPPISQVIQTRRMKLAGHVFRDKTSPAHLTVTWDPPHGKMSRGKPANTFIDTLLRDTGLDSPADLEKCMGDKKLWRCYQSRNQPSKLIST